MTKYRKKRGGASATYDEVAKGDRGEGIFYKPSFLRADSNKEYADVTRDLLLFGRYVGEINKIGAWTLAKTPTIETLRISKTISGSCYREMKEIKFKGNLLEYLCYVGIKMVLYEWGVDCEKRVNLFGNNFKNSIEVFESLIKTLEYTTTLRNVVLRIFFKNPELTFKTNNYLYVTSHFLYKFDEIDIKFIIFKIMSLFSFYEQESRDDKMSVASPLYIRYNAFRKTLIEEIEKLLYP